LLELNHLTTCLLEIEGEGVLSLARKEGIEDFKKQGTIK
jgi:hypothetical protein